VKVRWLSMRVPAGLALAAVGTLGCRSPTKPEGELDSKSLEHELRDVLRAGETDLVDVEFVKEGRQ
jgi:hypothetical protein